MAAKDNLSPSFIDKTSFWWAGLCAICHPGGGPTEFDRDGFKFYDEATGRFGYENLGLTATDVALDGDYTEVSNKTGEIRMAPWDVTGVVQSSGSGFVIDEGLVMTNAHVVSDSRLLLLQTHDDPDMHVAEVLHIAHD